MTDFYNPATRPVAAKEHQCIRCYGPIPKGEQHQMQTGVYEGAWFRNRFHDECWEDMMEWCDGEFTPGGGEVPARLATQAQDTPKESK